MVGRSEQTRSVAARVDHFAPGLGGQRAPGLEADAVLDELDRAVEEPDVHAALSGKSWH